MHNPTTRPIGFIHAPTNLGLGRYSDGREHRPDKLPQALAQTGLIEAIGAVEVAVLPRSPYPDGEQRVDQTRNAAAVREFTLALANAVCAARGQGFTPLVCGGDCSVLLGCGLALARTNRYALVFLDAHHGYDHPGNQEEVFDVAGADIPQTMVLVTAFSAVFISVDESILIGVGLSILMFVPRASRLSVRELIVTLERVVRERQPGDARSATVLIYDLEGELFFGAAPELEKALEKLQREMAGTGTRFLVLRLRRTRNPDVVAVEHLEHFLHQAEHHGLTVLLAGVREDLARIFRNLHFEDWLPADRIYPEEDKNYSATLRAVRRAYQLLHQNDQAASAQENALPEATYYLVP